MQTASDHGMVLPCEVVHFSGRCSRCGQPIAPRRARHADRLGGPAPDDYGTGAYSSPVKSYHLSGRCYEDHRKAAEKARRESPKAA